jgi:phosphoglycerate dehydrogenase-like enzyme
MVILLNAPVPPEQRKRVSSLSPTIKLLDVAAGAGPLPSEALEHAQVIYTTKADFDPTAAPCLRWVQLNTAGAEQIADKPIVRSEAPIANARGAYTGAVAELAMGMLITLTRRVNLACIFQRERHWPEDYIPFRGDDLYGRTLGIVGYGSIGRQIARLGQAMGMTILACKRRPEEKRYIGFGFAGTGDAEGTIPKAWYGGNQIQEMFRDSDVAVVALPQTPHTAGIIGSLELAALPPHAYLVNVGRGTSIDEAALIDCLRNGQLAGAALDVFASEPLTPENPIWDLPNVLITPHIASWTKLQAHRAAEVLIENVSRALRGEPLLNLIDKKLMY